MRRTALLGAALALLAGAGLAAAQTVTRGDQAPKPTTSSAPPRTTQAPSGPTSSGQRTPSRTMPSTLPVDPGGLGGLPAPGSPSAGPSYGPGAPGGVRTVRPRRSAEPPPETGSGDDIPYVDPPAAPGYESATDTPVRTAGGRPPPSASAHGAAPPPPSAPAAPTTTTASAKAPASPTAPASASAAPPPIIPIADGPVLPANSLWIALGGLAAMLAAAGLGLRHILAAPHLGFRVTMDNGVQSAPRFKGQGS